tara:strand:+ start:132 stop:2249 length:2118 start_codon:yes stop_codon:yes gene_type:complete
MSEQIDRIAQLAEVSISSIRDQKEDYFKPKTRKLEVEKKVTLDEKTGLLEESAKTPQLEKLEEEFKILKKYNAYEEQLDCLTKILKIKGNNPSALFNKGTILLRLKRYEEAIEAFDEKMLTVTTDADTYYNKAIAHNHLRAWEDAAYNAKIAREINPKLVDAWRLEGSILDDLGRYEEAIKCFDEAINLEPNHAIAWRHKGITLNKGLKQYENAIRCLEKARELDPNEIKVYENIASVYQKLGNIDEAEKFLQIVLKKDPNYIAALYRMAWILADFRDKREEAEKFYKKIVKIVPEDIGDLKRIIDSLDELKRWDEISEYCDEGISKIADKKDKAEFLRSKGRALGKLKEFEYSKECYNKAIELDPDEPRNWNGLGCVYSNDLKNHQEALECFLHAEKLSPENKVYLRNTLETLVGINKHDNYSTKNEEIIEYCDKLMIIDNENIDEYIIEKGLSLWSLSRNEEALECLNESLTKDKVPKIRKINPIGKLSNLGFAWCVKGQILGLLGKNEEEKECLEYAEHLKPDDAYILWARGDAYADEGKFTTAIKYFEKSIMYDPNEANVWHEKGNAERKIGEIKNSIVSFSEAIKLEPKNGMFYASKAIALLDSAEIAHKAMMESKFWDTKFLPDSNEILEEALELSDKAIHLDSENGMFYECKGRILEKQGKYLQNEYKINEAQENFKKAEEHDGIDVKNIRLPDYTID